MKRPLAVAGFTVLAVLIAAAYIGVAADAALGIFFLLSAAVVFFALKYLRFRREIVLTLLCAAAALGWYCGASLLICGPVLKLGGQNAVIEGTISEQPAVSNGGWVYRIKTDRITENGRASAVKTTIRLKTSDPLQATPFDRVKAEVYLYAPPQGDGDGFDSMSYYRSKGIYLFARPEGDITVTAAARRPLYFYAIALRQYISSTLAKTVRGQWGALSAGILIGDVSQLSAGIRGDFTATGISHILAVSGTQTSLITQYLLLTLCALRLRRRPAAVLTAGVVFGYMAVTGFSPSVMRAGIMSLLYLGALLIRKEPDALNSLGAAVLVLCAANPFAATDVGLLLSFAATLGMITVSQRLTALWGKAAVRLPGRVAAALKAPAGLLAETVGASLLTLPVIMLTFGQISGVVLLSNMLEVPASLFVTLAAAAIVLLAPLRIFAFVINPLALLVRIVTAFMTGYAHALAGLPFATLSTRYDFVGFVLLFAAVLILLYFLFRGRGASLGVVVVCICFTFSVGAASYTVASRGVLSVAALPVEDGSCTVLTCNGRAIVFDMSGNSPDYQAVQYLKSCGIRQVDMFILPAYDKQRVQASNSFLKSVGVRRIYIPGAYTSDENPAADCVTGISVLQWQSMTLELIPSTNGGTLFACLAYGGSSLLLTGGAAADLNQYSLKTETMRTGVLLFGGGVTQAFAKAVSPKIAVEEGENAAYGGALLKTMGCRVHDTEEDGRVTLRTRGNGIFTVD